MPKTKAKIFILEKGLNQKQVCAALGVSESFLSQLLDGKCQGNDALNRIAAYLNIPRQRLDRLIRGKKGVPSYAQLRTRGQRHAVPVDRSTASSPGGAPVPAPLDASGHTSSEI